MDEIGRQNAHDGTGAHALDNVVRLPYDWIGSRDELVPIGRSKPAVDQEPGLEMAPGAEDFWGEGSAAVQSALRAPADDSRVTRSGSAIVAGHRLRWARGSRRATAAAVGLIAGVLLIVGIVGFASPGEPRLSSVTARGPARAAAGGTRSTSSLAASVKTTIPYTRRPASHLANDVSVRLRYRDTRHSTAARTVTRSAATRHAHTHHERTRHAHPSAGAGAKAAPTFVSTRSPAPSHPVSPPSSPSSEQSTPSSETTAPATGSSHGQTPSATVSSASAGPAGPAALIGAGTSPSG